MASLPSVSTILKEASEITSRPKRVQFLQSHRPNKVMLQLLKYLYDPNIKFSLPEGTPPYTENDLPDQETRLYQEARRLYLFLEGNATNVPPLRKEAIFIEILEVVDPEDAKLLIAVKDKKKPYKGLTKTIIEEAFPGLLPNE